MAKVVIAGQADCPYFAKIELLADGLAKNLPDFKLHKIVKDPRDWEKWLGDTCNKRGWSHKKSPIVWRELVDRGGKGMLIGGANEFQEYAKGYYDLKSVFTSDDMKKIASENLQMKHEIDEEERRFKEAVTPVHICITNASSPVCYSMMEAVGKGDAFGHSTDISVRLLETEDNLDKLEGLEMEVFDLACPLLRHLTVTSKPAEAFTDCSMIILLDELEKGEEESKEEWLKRNNEHFVELAQIINDKARKDVKVVVGGRGPVNFNACMMSKHTQSIPRQNIVAVSRMVENNAKAIIAERLKVNSADVVDVTVWGQSYDKYFLDMSKARVHNYDGAIWGPPSFSLPVGEMVHDDKWLSKEFITEVEQRKEAVERSLVHRASASEAAALVSLIDHWWSGSSQKQTFSLGVYSEGWYSVPEGLVFSYPVTFNPAGYWSVVQDIDLTDENKQQINEIIKELQSEIEVIYPPPYVPPPTPSPEPEPTEDQDENKNNSSQREDGASDEEGPVLGRITEDKEGEEQAETEMVKRSGSAEGSQKDASEKGEEHEEEEDEDGEK